MKSANGDMRRDLLLIYIHGFCGNETSFQQFPLHVHEHATSTLSSTHCVHTKIYPRYKSRKAIDNAITDFSKWLHPHESQTTDVVLLGHSMGGILAADVALLRDAQGLGRSHRILGTVNLDTPFLGIHPRVVASGIGSLFRPGPAFPEPPSPPYGDTRTPGDSKINVSSEMNLSPAISRPSATSSSQNLATYNPEFPNDVRLPDRKGLDGFIYFFNKHLGGLGRATQAYFASHVEFGSCLTDWKGLRSRYAELVQADGSDFGRIRFVNYYTASTGRLKEPKRVTETGKGVENAKDSFESEGALRTKSSASEIGSSSDLEMIEDLILTEDLNALTPPAPAYPPLPLPFSDSAPAHSPPQQTSQSSGSPRSTSSAFPSISITEPPNLPPIPPPPAAPTLPSLSLYPDKSVFKLAKATYEREYKVYKRVMKDQAQLTKAREKLMRGWEKKRRKEEQETAKGKAEKHTKTEKEERKGAEKLEEADTTPYKDSQQEKDKKPRKPKTFCIIPSKTTSSRGGPERSNNDQQMQHENENELWVRVLMHGIDEVGAHCGLFFDQEPLLADGVNGTDEGNEGHYRWLVEDVVVRIQRWLL